MLKVLLILLFSICAFTDLTKRKIYNLVLLPAVVLGLVFSIGHSGLEGAKNSLLGLLVGGSLLIIPYLLGGMGAGDVKLLATVGAIGGVNMVLQVFIFGALAGGVLSLFVVLSRRELLSTLSRLSSPKMRHLPAPPSQTTVPYGLALAFGGFLAMFAG